MEPKRILLLVLWVILVLVTLHIRHPKNHEKVPPRPSIEPEATEVVTEDQEAAAEPESPAPTSTISKGLDPLHFSYFPYWSAEDLRRAAGGGGNVEEDGDSAHRRHAAYADRAIGRPESNASLAPSLLVAGEKECRLSQHAQKREIGALFHTQCTHHCFRKENNYKRPDFCSHERRHRADSYSFYNQPPNLALGKDAFGLVSSPLPAIFVALGSRYRGPGGQAHVEVAIEQFRRFHPTNRHAQVYLIVEDEKIEQDSVLVKWAQLQHARLVGLSEVTTPSMKRFQQVFYLHGLLHPGGNRATGNLRFNQYMLQRYYAILGLMEKLKLRHVVHLEGDNMVYGDMREVAKAVASCGHEMATLSAASSQGMVPGVLYIKDAAAIDRFTSYLNDFLSCGKKFGEAINGKDRMVDDRAYLMNYYEYYGSEAMGQLPSWEHREGESCVASVMDGGRFLFDAGSFGQWYSYAALQGKSYPPGPIREKMRRRFLNFFPGQNRSSSADVADREGGSQLAGVQHPLKWVRDKRGRRVPLWKDYRLLSLHVEGKNMEFFRS